jgi:hypothetical protein
MAGQQFVNQVVPYGHGSLQARSGLHYDPSHEIPDRLDDYLNALRNFTSFLRQLREIRAN